MLSPQHCKGEASVSNRKGKKIVAFELDVKFTWEGQVPQPPSRAQSKEERLGLES